MPNGLRTLSISNKTCKSLIIPRSAIDKIKDREELSQPSLYFLLNDDENKIYIGESENFIKRIKDHERKKDFWNLAITFHSQTNDLTKADVKYLEYLSVNATKKISSLNFTENNQNPTCPNLPEHQKSSINEFFEDIKLITGFAGYNFLTEIKKESKNLFYCKRSGINSEAIFEDNKLIVLKNSKISSKEDSWYNLKNYKRENLIKNNKIKILDDNFMITLQDMIFNSPSSASSFCIGKPSNGWIDWKNSKNKTLDEVIRKK
jgi:hypothetical protein